MKVYPKFIYCAIVLMMVCLPSFAQNYFERTILYSDSIPNDQLSMMFIPTLDQNILLFTGRLEPGTNKYEIFLSKSDNAGNELWTSRIDIQQPAFFFRITEFRDSTFYISGFISAAGNFGNLLVHVSKDGLLLSAKVISSPDITMGYGFDITTLSDSTLVMVARAGQTNFYSGNIIVDGSGNPVSNRFFTVNNKAIVKAKSAKSPNGGFVQVLEMRRPNNNNDRILGIVSCDANGDIIWAKQFGDLIAKYQIYDIKHLPSGEIILCGSTASGAASIGMVMCVDSNGNLIWTKHFNPGRIVFFSIVPNDVASFIVTGMLNDTSTIVKAVVVKMGLNGQILDNASYRYTDIILNSQSTFKDDNNMFYTAYNYRLTGVYFWGTMISKYDLGFYFCNPYSLSITTTPVFMTDSAQWSDTTYSLVTADVTSLFSQTFDPWGYGIHCISTGIDPASEQEDALDIFPNPTTGKLMIRSESFELTNVHFKIIDLFGKIHQSGSFDGLENTLDISTLGKGVYFLQTQRQGYTSTKKLILN